MCKVLVWWKEILMEGFAVWDELCEIGLTLEFNKFEKHICLLCLGNKIWPTMNLIENKYILY